jgi:hypothetical protein
MVLARELRALATDVITTTNTKRKLHDDTAIALVKVAQQQGTSTRTAKYNDNRAGPAFTPSKRQKKAAEEGYECQQCGEEKSSSSFPDDMPSSTCEHLIHTCKLCLKTWVNLQIANGSYVTQDERSEPILDEHGEPIFGIRCPEECKGIMTSPEVLAATTPLDHAVFKKAARKTKLDSTPGWRWCMNPKCDASQVHTKGKICTCIECGARVCIPCDRPFHVNQTCKDYKTRVHSKEEVKSLEKISATTKACPNPTCRVRIEKNLGCTHMICKLWCGV